MSACEASSGEGKGTCKDQKAHEEETALEEHGVEDGGRLVLKRVNCCPQALEHVAGKRLDLHATSNTIVTVIISV